MQTRLILGTALLALLLAPALRADIGYQFATVGNPGNAADSTSYGSVGYTYAIGTYDVTLTQYTAFLNAVAATDTYSLYNSNMATDLNVAGIHQNGASGSYTYSVIGSGQRPVTYVNWFDAARFTNWLHNGQPTGLGEVAGSTEQGAYALNGTTTGGLTISKNLSARDWIPSEDEWYKAAYYDPSLNGGTGGYWTYATKSNSAPGNIIGSSANQANYYTGVYSVTQTGVGNYSSTQNYLTDVGAFTGSASAYGTYDQSGDVFQWNDAVVGSTARGRRGGDWGSNTFGLMSSIRPSGFPTDESDAIGFRVATVPEPGVAVSFILAGGLLIARRRRAV